MEAKDVKVRNRITLQGINEALQYDVLIVFLEATLYLLFKWDIAHSYYNDKY